MKAAQLIGHLFLARDVAHVVHLNTKSYAQHKALNEFYDEVVDLADKFAEAYQGRKGLIGVVSLQEAKRNHNIITFLEDSLQTIEDNRYTIVDKTDTPLQNIIDEIVGLYLSTLYKLKNLS